MDHSRADAIELHFSDERRKSIINSHICQSYYDGDGSLYKYDMNGSDIAKDTARDKLIEYYNEEWKDDKGPHYPYFVNIDSDSDTELIIDGGFYEKDQFIRGMAVFDYTGDKVIERYKTTGLQNVYLVPLDDYYKIIISGDTKTQICL